MGNALPYTGSFKDDFGKTKEEQEQQNKETSMYSSLLLLGVCMT